MSVRLKPCQHPRCFVSQWSPLVIWASVRCAVWYLLRKILQATNDRTASRNLLRDLPEPLLASRSIRFKSFPLFPLKLNNQSLRESEEEKQDSRVQNSLGEDRVVFTPLSWSEICLPSLWVDMIYEADSRGSARSPAVTTCQHQVSTPLTFLDAECKPLLIRVWNVCVISFGKHVFWGVRMLYWNDLFIKFCT